jgi:hypothetical protein
MTKAATPESARPFHEIHMQYFDLVTSTHVAIQRNIFDKLTRRELDPEGMVYTGIEGRPIRETGTFGERRRTWGTTAEAFIREAATADRVGVMDDWHPLYYVVGSAHELPALAVLDKDALIDLYDPEFKEVIPNELERRPGFPACSEWEWEVKPGLTMDDAARAVIYFAHQ